MYTDMKLQEMQRRFMTIYGIQPLMNWKDNMILKHLMPEKKEKSSKKSIRGISVHTVTKSSFMKIRIILLIMKYMSMKYLNGPRIHISSSESNNGQTGYAIK